MTPRKPTTVDQSLPFHSGAGVWVDTTRGVALNRFGRVLGCAKGHAYVRLSNGAGLHYLHRVVYEAAHGAIPDGMQINHIDGDKTNNALSNLELVTQAENARHASITGLMQHGERNHRARLTAEQVQEIRNPMRLKTNAEWAREFGVSRSAISLIRSGKNWTQHVAGCLKLLREDATNGG